MDSRPRCLAVDALPFCWEDFKPYIFPPFSLLGKVLHKLKLEEVSDAIIIAPWWPAAPWYPQLLLVQRPVLLPQWDTLLTLPQEDTLHPLKDVMRLVAWHVSGIVWSSEEFLRGLPCSQVLEAWNRKAAFCSVEMLLLLVKEETEKSSSSRYSDSF